MIKYQVGQISDTEGLSKYYIAGLAALQLLTAETAVASWRDLDIYSKPVAYRAESVSPSVSELSGVLTGAYKQFHDPLEGTITAEFNPFIEQLNAWIDSTDVPEKWREQEIQSPTFECRTLAKSAVLKLLQENRLYPARISASIEEDIFIGYANHISKVNLSIEVYNSLEIAAIVTKGKEIIKATDIENENFSEILAIYNGR